MKDSFYLDLMVSFPSSNDKIDDLKSFSDRLGLDYSGLDKEKIKKNIINYKDSVYLTIEDIKTNNIRATLQNIDQNLTIRNLSYPSENYEIAYNEAKVLCPELDQYSPDTLEAKKYVLLWAIYMGNRLAYCREAERTDAMVLYPECCIPCTLHGECRIGEAIFNKLQQDTYNKHLQVRKKDALEKMKELSVVINAALEGIPETSFGNFDSKLMTYEIKTDVSSNKVSPFKLSCVRQRKVYGVWDHVVECCFPADFVDGDILRLERKQDYLELGHMFNFIRDSLRKDDDFTDEEINSLQLKMDTFCDKYTTMFGLEITNYIHLWQSGDLCFYLKRYGNIHRHNTTCMEAIVGYLRSFLFRRTQNNGSSGNKDGRKKFALSKAVKKIMLRKTGRSIGRLRVNRSPASKNIDLVSSLTTKGRDINKGTNEGNRKRGRPKKEMLKESQESFPDSQYDER
jgi:hypothetical protein